MRSGLPVKLRRNIFAGTTRGEGLVECSTIARRPSLVEQRSPASPQAALRDSLDLAKATPPTIPPARYFPHQDPRPNITLPLRTIRSAIPRSASRRETR